MTIIFIANCQNNGNVFRCLNHTLQRGKNKDANLICKGANLICNAKINDTFRGSNMLTNYLNTLKNKGNFTIETVSNLSGVPESTVKNIFTGKTEDPRFETVAAIVLAMGGSLDAIYSAAKKEDIEANAVITIKESYEHRIADIREHYEHRLREQKERYEERIEEINEHIETIKLDKRWFRIACVVSVLIFAMLCVAELLNPNLGWFRY